MYDRRPKSNFCGLSVSEQAKVRGFSRSRIWFKISVAYHRNVTSVQKPPKLVAISLRRFGALVLYRIVAASGSLPQQNFDYAKRRRFSPLRMTYSGFVGRYAFVFTGCRGRHPLQQILKFTVGAIHESPALCLQYAFVFAGCRGRHPAPNDNSKTTKDRGTRSLAGATVCNI